MNENSKENNGKYSEPGKHYGPKKRKCFKKLKGKSFKIYK
jgi:hypothetical protein